jgi:phosphoserine phosphatase
MQTKSHELNIPDVEFIVFDLDGVLVDTVSSWVWVHDHFGVNNDESHIKYMREEIDDKEFMRSDIALWFSKKHPLHIDEIRGILNSVPIMAGFEPMIDQLDQLNIETAIVSSGLEPLAERIGKLGNILHVFANGIETDESGHLTGEGILNVKLRRKGEVVKQLISELGYAKEKTLAVGNGETDIPMFDACGFGLAFNPINDRPAQCADAVIYEKDLTEICRYITSSL